MTPSGANTAATSLRHLPLDPLVPHRAARPRPAAVDLTVELGVDSTAAASSARPPSIGCLPARLPPDLVPRLLWRPWRPLASLRRIRVLPTRSVSQISQEEACQISFVLRVLFASRALASTLASSRAAASSAQGVTVSGHLYHSVSTKPVAGATVLDRRDEARSEINRGRQLLHSERAGRHVSPSRRCSGLRARARRADRRAPPVTLDVNVDPELHYSEVRVGESGRAQPFESYQPTTVLAGQDLAKQLAGIARRDAAEQPGVARAIVRAWTVAAGDSRPGRRSRADPRGRSAHRRSLEPVGRSRRDRSIRPARRASRSCAVPRRCSTAPTPSAVSST